MCLRVNYIFVFVLCVLNTVSHAEDAKCVSFIDDLNTFTLNCSRRAFEALPSAWPDEVLNIDNERHVLITFFNNSITSVPQLPAVSGSRVAISFKNNRINFIADDAFANVHRLVYLDVSNNLITGDILRSEIFQGPYENGVYGCLALETLNLGYNKIHSLDRYLFQHTPNLTRLYLNNNPIELLDYVTILAIASATNLEVLDLAYTDIETIPLDAFKTLTNLQQVDLSGNKFVTVPESLSLVGETLEYLNFNNNPIVELNDDSFIGLKNLKELEVGQNDFLEEIKRSTFSPLKSLRVLHVCHNRNLRYISHNAFRGLKDKWTLKEVYLDDNNLSELPTDLMPWRQLDILGMTGNNWLCNCDLANIVTTQGAKEKFNSDSIPYCVAPMKWSGMDITKVTLENCPTLDSTFAAKKDAPFSSLRPKHIIWSIFSVGMVAMFGMLLGLLVNKLKAAYKKTIKDRNIRYRNINSEFTIA